MGGGPGAGRSHPRGLRVAANPGERDVLIASRSGATVAEIAARLYLAEGTVRNYLSGATTKSGTRN